MALALIVALLVAGGVYMILRRGMMRIVVGFILLSHGVNLLLVAAGGLSRREPAIGTELDPAVTADPLPQAFVLTAIVIAFAVTIFMLGLSAIGDGDDDTELDLTGRAMELPELLHADPAAEHLRAHPPTNWHAYLDRADDTPGVPAPDETSHNGRASGGSS